MAELGSLNPAAQREIINSLGPAERQRYGVGEPPQQRASLSGSLQPGEVAQVPPSAQTTPMNPSPQPRHQANQQWTESEHQSWFGPGGGAQ